MEVEAKEIETCTLEVLYQADKDLVKAKIEEGIDRWREAPVKGFRPGKAPDKAIRAFRRREIDKWVKKELLIQAYDDVIYEKELRPVGHPEFVEVDLKGHAFKCRMVLLHAPEFELQDFRKAEVPAPPPLNPDASIEANLDALRERYGEIEPYREGDFVEAGDEVTMDIVLTTSSTDAEGVIHTEKHEDPGCLYKIGSNRYPDFDDNLLGMEPGASRTFEGKAGELTVGYEAAIHMGTKTVKCALDDELAVKVGATDLANLLDLVRERVVSALQNQQVQELRPAITEWLATAHDFPVPARLAVAEAKKVARAKEREWKTLEGEELEGLMDLAKRSVRLSIILDRLRDEYPDATLSDVEAREAFQKRLLSSGRPVEEAQKIVQAMMAEGTLLPYLGAVRDEYTLQWVSQQRLETAHSPLVKTGAEDEREKTDESAETVADGLPGDGGELEPGGDREGDPEVGG